MSFLPQELIRKKRDGKALTFEEIAFIVEGLTKGTMSDEQIGAFAMAVFFQGMSLEERIALTSAMRDSGSRLDWRAQDLGKPVVLSLIHISIVLITHKLREIVEATDAVTVMRQGEVIATVNTRDTDKAQLAEMMVGRRVNLFIPKAKREPGPVVLEGRGLGLVDRQGVGRLQDLHFTVRAGEIVGVAGVSGNGQSELLDILSGIRAPTSGGIFYHGKPLPALNGAGAAYRARGIAHVPEDRTTMGLVKTFPAYENAILGYHCDAGLNCKTGVLRMLFDRRALMDRTESFMRDFDVRPPNPVLRTALFSGGNQQKLVLAREIHRDPDLLLIGQPTRGVDIGAIEFIHRRIMQLRDAGKAVLLVSVELDEILSLSDRIMVMNAGRISGIVPRDEADERRLGLMMAGEGARTGGDE